MISKLMRQVQKYPRQEAFRRAAVRILNGLNLVKVKRYEI
jgi:hypothetical protein